MDRLGRQGVSKMARRRGMPAAKMNSVLASIPRASMAWKRSSVSIPTAPTKNPDDSVALGLLNLPNKTIKQGVLVPRWSQLPPVETGRRWTRFRVSFFSCTSNYGSLHFRCHSPCVRLDQFDSGARMAITITVRVRLRALPDTGTTLVC